MMDNASAVRIFTLSGLNETMNYRIAIFSVTFLYYCVVLFVNISLIAIIFLDENLHEPMYIFLCSFCINGLYGASGFYPKFLFDLLSFSHEISYEGCLLQAFVMYSFACCEMSILAVMAYDRYLAICQPLQYHSFMTRRRISVLVCSSWLLPLCIFSLSIFLTSTLNLCGSKIQKLFCVNWVIYELACSESNTLANNIISHATTLIYVFHGFFIIWTYIHLAITCTKSKEDRVKFVQTCIPHLVSLIIFLFVIVFDLMFTRFGSNNLPNSVINLIGIKFVIFPPLVNPIIYGFKLQKVRCKIAGYMKTHSIISAYCVCRL
uniref:Olfactory receptor 5F1 n=1 Tax=Takifugu rubripes TaxID=31033 RepID=H2TMQ6_TAKRU